MAVGCGLAWRCAGALLLLAAAGPAPDDAEAAFQLGIRAELGQDQPADAALAYHWYRVAAGTGYAPAELNVAIMQDSGRGTAHDPAQAAEWYARAAARNDRRAQYDLALLYAEGDGVPRNPEVARAWFKAAAANGLAAASEHLGAMTASDPAQGGPPLPVTLVAPRPDKAVTLAPDGSAEFVWSVPAPATGSRYFLQVAALDGTGLREIDARPVEVTAAVVRLDPSCHACAWRVYSVSSNGRYSVTPWSRFTLGGAS